jgi:hypothetical protein
MSTHDEDRLSRSLHDRAGDMSGAPVGLADVQRSARGIQRRRRVAGGLVAAVVVAVAVPVALNVTGSPGVDRPVAPATTSPSVSPTPSAIPSGLPGGVTPLTVDGAPDGGSAAITYLRGRTVVVPGGSPVDLPTTYDTVAPYRGGWLAVERKDGTPYVVHLDASGQVTSSKRGGDRIVVSQDGVEVAWAEAGRLYLDTTNGHSEQPRSIAAPKGAVASPIGFVGPGSVAVVVEGPEQGSWVTDFQSFTALPKVLKVSATDESHGVLGVLTSYDSNDGTSCWALRAVTGGDQTKTCDWTVETFSPDGAHFVGYPSDTDGIGASTIGLLDSSTAGPVATFERQGNNDTYVSDVVWEDESHALASLHEGDAWYLVRLGLDGSLEKVDESPGNPDESPFHFAAHS